IWTSSRRVPATSWTNSGTREPTPRRGRRLSIMPSKRGSAVPRRLGQFGTPCRRAGKEQHTFSMAVKSEERWCIHERFEAQVARTPLAIAAILDEAAFTYDVLNRKAKRIAHRLSRLGVGPEVPVVISVERSLDMLAGVLGILKAGGAYVPLDPLYPRDRLAFVLSDTRAPVLVTHTYLREALPRSERLSEKVSGPLDSRCKSLFLGENPRVQTPFR